MKALLTWTESIHILLWSRIFNTTQLDIKSLCAFRIIFGLFFLFVNTPNFAWIASVPKALFSPPPLCLSNLFNSFPNTVLFQSIDIIILLGLISITLGIKARIGSIFFLAACLLGLSFQYSFGKVDHENLIYALLLCMTFSNWGCDLALWPDKALKTEWTNMALAVLSVFICFAMFTAGAGKALAWVDFDLSTNGFLGWSQRGISDQGRNYLLSTYVASFPPLLLESMDYAAVIFELSPIFFLLHSKRAWRLWLLIACFFHLGNTLFLNIPFMSQSLLYLIFVDFSWLYKKITKFFSVNKLKPVIFSCVAIIFALRITFYFLQPSPLYGESYSAKVNMGLVVWIIAIFVILKSLLKGDPKSDSPSFQSSTRGQQQLTKGLIQRNWAQYRI